MLSVKILGFGTNWWARFGCETADPWRFTRHAVYYNSAGLVCGKKIRRHWIIPGMIRFNGIGGFDPHFPNRSIGKTFCCHDPLFGREGNRLLLEGKGERNEVPDYCLTVISSERHGIVDFTNPYSRSDSVLVLVVSELHGRQEALVLMKMESCLKSSLGFWQLTSAPQSPNNAVLRLTDSPDFVPR